MCGSGSVFGIRIQKSPEYGSNTDPDVQNWLKQEQNPAMSTILSIKNKLRYLQGAP